jgi:SAM-dependent methyltransferase
MATQEVFKTVYRGRQSALHHMAYMRMSKVLLSRYLLGQAGISLENKSIFDYGFGAGTFFRFCPTTARIAGVEMDPVAIEEVRQMCLRCGHTHVELAPIDVEHWEDHPLLRKQYDLFLCSHVLEHLPDPVGFLKRTSHCLTKRGVFVGLLPINELRANVHHVQTVDRSGIEQWLIESGLILRHYLEGDPWNYWVQPLFADEGGAAPKLRRFSAQAFSLAMGIPATVMGPRAWAALSKWFGSLSFSKPSQAAFLAERSAQLT